MFFLNRLFKTIYLPVRIHRVLKNINTQKRFLRQQVDGILKKAMQENDGSIDHHDFNKINDYYGLAVPAILGEAFCCLRGHEMSLAERWASTGQGAMTGLFDDFFDKDYMANHTVENMIYLKEVNPANRSNQKLFEQFYKTALENAPDKKLMTDALVDVFNAQVESKKQEGSLISWEELMRITFFKGGSSLVFYRSVFSPEATEKEKELIYQLGSLMQLANDIFDVYKDRESGVKTLVTETCHIREIRSILKKHLEIYYATAFQLNYPSKNTRAFLDILSIGIFSRALVCLDQLENNEKFSGNRFEVNAYTRKQLICDMEKRRNLLRAACKHILEIP